MPRSLRPEFKPDTLEKALTVINVIHLIRLEGVAAGLRFIFQEYPETRNCTHKHLGELLGLTRESITRAWPLV